PRPTRRARPTPARRRSTEASRYRGKSSWSRSDRPFRGNDDGGGGNRTPVRGRTERASTSVAFTFSLARDAGVRRPTPGPADPEVSCRRRSALLWHQPVG